MRAFLLRINGFEIQWDRTCGVWRRGGWSIRRRGIYLAAFEPWLVVAVVKACRGRSRPIGGE